MAKTKITQHDYVMMRLCGVPPSVETHVDDKCCGARNARGSFCGSDGLGWYCTCAKNHDGVHIGHASHEGPVAMWYHAEETPIELREIRKMFGEQGYDEDY